MKLISKSRVTLFVFNLAAIQILDYNLNTGVLLPTLVFDTMSIDLIILRCITSQLNKF